MGLYLVQAKSIEQIKTAEANLPDLSCNELGSPQLGAWPAELQGRGRLVQEGGWEQGHFDSACFLVARAACACSSADLHRIGILLLSREKTALPQLLLVLGNAQIFIGSTPVNHYKCSSYSVSLNWRWWCAGMWGYLCGSFFPQSDSF